MLFRCDEDKFLTFKILSSVIVPRPIAWVVTLDTIGQVNAAPFSYFNLFSTDPATICIGVNGRDDGGQKDTARNLVCSPSSVSEVEIAGIGLEASTDVAPPRISQSPVALECRVTHTLQIGRADQIFVGEVIAVHICDDLIEPGGGIDFARLDLVGRVNGSGRYVRLRDVFEVPRVDAVKATELAIGQRQGRREPEDS
jgi:flavin reductase (DIM6/NTAB) family NADH-FMN oxidoreductase RutF